MRRHRARKMLAEEVWTELKQTVSDLDRLDEERKVLAPFLSPWLDEQGAASFYAPIPRPAGGPEG